MTVPSFTHRTLYFQGKNFQYPGEWGAVADVAGLGPARTRTWISCRPTRTLIITTHSATRITAGTSVLSAYYLCAEMCPAVTALQNLSEQNDRSDKATQANGKFQSSHLALKQFHSYTE